MRRRRYLALGLIGAVVLGGVLWVVDSREGERTELGTEHVQYQDCREGNLPNAYVRLVLARSPGFDPAKLGVPNADDVLPILSCAETVESGHPVRLRQRQERRYLRVVARSCLPIVDNGKIVGAEALPGRSDHRRCRRLSIDGL